MANSSTTTRNYYDVITSFEQGVNSGITPILLPKNQVAFALNATVRGGNITTRPPIQRQTLFFGGDAALEDAVLNGFFQGSGVYRPDFGPTQIIAQITGHLYSFTPVGDAWVVADISVPGDLNDPTVPQVWMWQSEKWLIVTDGTAALPIFYDGITSRRSHGPSVLLGTTTAGFVVPPLGDLLTVTLTAPYTGALNIPVILNGAFYEVISNAVVPPLSAYFATLTTKYNSAGTVGLGTGYPLYVNQSKIGFVESSGSVFFDPNPNRFAHFTAVLSTVENLTVGDLCAFTPALPSNFTVETIDILTRTVQFKSSVVYGGGLIPPAAGTLVTLPNGNQTNFLVALGVGGIAVPAVGASVVVSIDRLYSGPAGQTVWTTDTLAWTIEAFVPPPAPPSTTLTLRNISDTGPDPVVGQDILSVPELPAGRMGAYGMGRNWMSLIDGISYIGGDLVGGASGTDANNRRDAVLCTTENDFLAAGGTFRLPSSGNVITSMTFMAVLDASQGQGPLQVGTDSGMFSNNTPVNRDDWTNLVNPILTQSMIGAGPLGQNSTLSVNSDILFRCIEGLGSLVVARRNFNAVYSWGNSSISREMDPIFRADDPNFLVFGSAVNFDNRLLTTVAPAPSGKGTFHQGSVALNYDTVNSMTQKSNPVYDGLWTGMNILQFMTGNFSGTGRSFAFSLDLEDPNNTRIRLYELLTTIGGRHFDNGTTRIRWIFETPVMFNRDVKPMSELVRLLDGEMYLQDVDGLVDFTVEYRPDFYPCWVTWKQGQICADRTVTNSRAGYRTRLSLGEPTTPGCDPANDNRLLNIGHFFQFRFTFTGHLKFMGFRAQVTTDPARDFAPPLCADTCLETIPMPQ